MANKADATFEYNRAFLPAFTDAMLQEIAQVFEGDIKPEAQELSPVDKGTNRRSITTEASRTPEGNIQAEIFTQSGYGGYLELGHKVRGAGAGGFDVDPADFVQGRPYIFPAFMKYKQVLLTACVTGYERMEMY